jgi:hypothetical protein
MGYGLARKIVDNHSVDVSPGRGGVDKSVRFLEVKLVGNRVAQPCLQNPGKTTHPDGQLALNIFSVLFNAEIAVHHHGKDDDSD